MSKVRSVEWLVEMGHMPAKERGLLPLEPVQYHCEQVMALGNDLEYKWAKGCLRDFIHLKKICEKWYGQ